MRRFFRRGEESTPVPRRARVAEMVAEGGALVRVGSGFALWGDSIQLTYHGGHRGKCP